MKKNGKGKAMEGLVASLGSSKNIHLLLVFTTCTQLVWFQARQYTELIIDKWWYSYKINKQNENILEDVDTVSHTVSYRVQIKNGSEIKKPKKQMKWFDWKYLWGFRMKILCR